MDTSAARAASETAAGNRHPATGERFPETDDAFPAAGIRLPDPGPLPETDDPTAVCLPRDVVRQLTFGADAFREAWNAAVESDDPAYADLIACHIDDLVRAGVVSAEDGRTTASFDAACAIGGAALGIITGSAAGREGFNPLREVAQSPLAPDNEDFEADVISAEAAFTASPDPDWPADDLPRAGSFGGD